MPTEGDPKSSFWRGSPLQTNPSPTFSIIQNSLSPIFSGLHALDMLFPFLEGSSIIFSRHTDSSG